jgi:hypothetical protein
MTTTENDFDSLTPEQRGLATVGVMLGAVVEDVLNASLEGRRIKACKHVKLGTPEHLKGFTSVEVERAVYLCPMHPERLLCSEGMCLRDHLAKFHPADDVRCFVCEAKCLTDFTPVDARIVLHRNINVEFPDGPPGDMFLTALSYAYGGVISTLPAAYLCPGHAWLLPKPFQIGWPMTAAGVRPEDVSREQ